MFGKGQQLPGYAHMQVDEKPSKKKFKSMFTFCVLQFILLSGLILVSTLLVYILYNMYLNYEHNLPTESDETVKYVTIKDDLYSFSFNPKFQVTSRLFTPEHRSTNQ